MKLCIPKLTHAIPSQGRGSVTAVASVGDDVFVLRNKSQEVEVYHAEKFALKCYIKVAGLGFNAYGLAVCPNNSCLYASGLFSDSVHRVELKAGNAAKNWSVSGRPAGLSVNKANNLIVVSCSVHELLEYTTHGSLVRKICLEAAGVSDPWHAVQLSSGDYAVSHGEQQGGVSVVGVDGKVVQRYGQSVTSEVGQMKNPTSLAVTKNDDILVADNGNDRIALIKKSTGCIEKLALQVEGGIQRPMALCLDESRGRLYVGEYAGEYRLLLFDGVAV